MKKYRKGKSFIFKTSSTATQHLVENFRMSIERARKLINYAFIGDMFSADEEVSIKTDLEKKEIIIRGVKIIG